MLIAVTSTSVLCVCCAALPSITYIGGAHMALAHCAMNQHRPSLSPTLLYRA